MYEMFADDGVEKKKRYSSLSLVETEGPDRPLGADDTDHKIRSVHTSVTGTSAGRGSTDNAPIYPRTDFI